MEPAELIRFLERRQRLLGLTFDVATFLHWIPAELQLLWPSSRFLLVLRDPEAWVCSYLGMVYNIRQTLKTPSDLLAYSWVERYGRRQASHLSVFQIRDTLASTEETQALMEELIDFWQNRLHTVCSIITTSNLEIISLTALQHSLPSIASWLGLPYERLGSLPRLNSNPAPSLLQHWLLEQAHQVVHRSAIVREAIDCYEHLAAA